MPVLALVLLAASPLVSRGETPSDKTPPPSSEEIRQWISDLDADEFVVREQATLNLFNAGRPAIEPLADALRGKSLEMTARGIYVLEQLAKLQDSPMEVAARSALEQLAAAGGTAAARRAAATLAELNVLRRDRAIVELRANGAKITTDHVMVGLEVAERYSVEIADTWQGKEQDLEELRWLTDVSQVLLEGEQVTDRWLRHVGKMKKLDVLTIKRGDISSRGLQHLAELERVETLNLMYVPVDDTAIEILKTMPSVGTMFFIGTKISTHGADRLRDALAGTRIDHRDGAFLGVGCQATAFGCTIFTVRTNTAASRAGLVPGDVIMEYNGKKVEDFDQLTGFISRNSAGDTVSLKIRRGGKEATYQVKLGEWE